VSATNETDEQLRDELAQANKRFAEMGKTAHQVGERKHLDETLRESEAQPRNMLDTMLAGCQIIGFDWRYIYMNDAAAKHGRVPRAEKLGRVITDVYPGIENTALYSKLQDCMEQRIPHHMENEFTFPNGSKGWFDLSIQPVPEGIFMLSTDITEHKLAQQQLLEFVLEKQRTIVLTNFITKASEKFEVPLSTILTDTHLLRRVTMPDEREEHIRDIEEQVDSITMLVNALTIMSRLDGGHELRLETVDLNEIIRVTVDILKTVFQEKNPNIVLELTECQLLLQGDYDYLGQVVRHILDNAIRYTPGGGTITVRSELVHNNAMIEIIDTGPGINEQQLEHVFERFYRTEAAENMPGLGLGLSIAKAVVERHEGRIEVQSEVDKGSVFRISLPIKQ
jgi:PAS domain S-box-containing protein